MPLPLLTDTTFFFYSPGSSNINNSAKIGRFAILFARKMKPNGVAFASGGAFSGLF